MEPFDVIEANSPGFGTRLVVTADAPFAFAHAEEALGGGIVGTAADRAHTADEIVTHEKALNIPRV